MPTLAKPHVPRWYTVPIRVALITFFLTLLGFALCLFASILWTVIAARVNGVTPDMRMAYRHIAVPSAVIIGSVVLIGATIHEVKHYRRTRALAGIVQASRGRAA